MHAIRIQNRLMFFDLPKLMDLYRGIRNLYKSHSIRSVMEFKMQICNLIQNDLKILIRKIAQQNA